MKCIATYPTYEEANERQLDLLAADLDAKVEYVPTGADQVYFGRNPIYALVVDEDQVAAAKEIIRLIPDESHVCLYACPKCGSSDVQECRPDRGFDVGGIGFALTFGLLPFIQFLTAKKKGRKYICRRCGCEYRKKP